MKLTLEQSKAIDKLEEFMHSDGSYIILQGYAGTGKTTIITELYKRDLARAKMGFALMGDEKATYTSAYPTFKFTATTHKAKHALQAALNSQDWSGLLDGVCDLEVSTIHSALHLIPTPDGYKQSMEILPPLHKILVIDECSYIDYDLLAYIQKCVNDYHIKVIFMGDRYQLPPVGLNHCPVFLQGYPTVYLHKAVRQINAPLINTFATAFRGLISGKPLTGLQDDGKQVIRLDKKQWDKKMVEVFNQSTNAKVIRYTNHQTNQTNNKLFKAIHKRSNYEPNDYIVVNSYYDGIKSDTELVIDKVQEMVYMGIDVYALLCTDASDKARFIMTPKDVKAAKKLGLQHLFPDIRRVYACTVHKSQGSTYDEVFINLNDYKRLYQTNEKMMAHLLYVALSRARHKVYLTGDIV